MTQLKDTDANTKTYTGRHTLRKEAHADSHRCVDNRRTLRDNRCIFMDTGRHTHTKTHTQTQVDTTRHTHIPTNIYLD